MTDAELAAKPYRMLWEMHDEAYRPLIRTMADVIDKIEAHGFKPVGRLRGVRSEPDFLAGRFGALCRIEGETDCERFGCPIPFTDGLIGFDQSGKERFVPIKWFDTLEFNLDGSVLANRGLLLRRVSFRLIDLPFEWSDQKYSLSQLISRYVNETGLSQAALGRELNTGHPEYMEMSNITVRELKPVVEYVKTAWLDVSDAPAPSRETIAATLEGLNMRQRTRGRNGADG